MKKIVVFGAEISIPKTNGQIEIMKEFVSAVKQFEYTPQLFKRLEDLISNNNSEAIYEISLCIKSVLEQQSAMYPFIQFNTLRILKRLVGLFNNDFQEAVEVNILPVLKQICLFQKDSSDESRGKYYFVHESYSNAYFLKLGDSFLRLALESIQMWSSWFKGEFEKAFQFLKDTNKVTFPTVFTFYLTTMMSKSTQEMLQEQQKVSQKLEVSNGIVPPMNSTSAADQQAKSSPETELTPLQKVNKLRSQYSSQISIELIKDQHYPGSESEIDSLQMTLNQQYKFEIYQLYSIAKRMLFEAFKPNVDSFITVAASKLLNKVSQSTLLEIGRIIETTLLEPLVKLCQHQFRIKVESLQNPFTSTNIPKQLKEFQQYFPNCKKQDVFFLVPINQDLIDRQNQRYIDALNLTNIIKPISGSKLIQTEEEVLKGKGFSGDRKMQIFQNKLVIFEYIEHFNEEAFDQESINLVIGKPRKQIRYYSAKDLNDVFLQLLPIENTLRPLTNIEIRFTLEKVQTEYTQKFQPANLTLSRMSFKSCSTELISQFIFLNAAETQKMPRAIEIISSYISNSEFIEIIHHFNRIINKQSTVNQNNGQMQQQQQSFPIILMKFFLENCKNISYTSFESFNHSIDTCSQIQESCSQNNRSYRDSVKVIQLNLAMKTVKTFTHQDFLKLSTFESFRSLKALKLKSVEGENMGRVIGDLLSNRLVYCTEKILDDYFYQSFLRGLSFDSSVCDQFDSLCLDQEYYQSIKKLRFKNKEINKHVISFSKMKPYSLSNMIELKLKNCSLTDQFFPIFSTMKCLSNLKILVLRGCDFDQAELSLLIKLGSLKALKCIDLSYTQTGDDLCYSLYSSYSQTSTLETVDVSNNLNKELTHQGIKYLTFITSIRSLKINNCPNAVDDTLSPYILDLIKRKWNRFNKQMKEKSQDLILNARNQLKQHQRYAEQLDSHISQAKLYAEGFKEYLDYLTQMKQSLVMKIKANDNSFYYSQDDNNLYLDIQLERHMDQVEEVNEILSNLNFNKQKSEEEKIVFEKEVNRFLKDSSTFPFRSCIRSIDLSGNKNITTAFFIDLAKAQLIHSIFYLKLSQTNVCGGIARILTHTVSPILNSNRAPSLILDEKSGEDELKVLDLNKQISSKKDQLEQNLSNRTLFDIFGTNQQLEVLNLSKCKSILPEKFEQIFQSQFKNLMELNLNGCTFFDNQFDMLRRNRKRGFPSLVTINLKQTNLTNQALWTFLMESEQLLEIYLDNTNFSVCPPGLRKSSIIKKKEQTTMTKEKKKEIDYGNLTQEILPKVFTFSVSNCKIWEDKQILEILHAVLSPIFDFNSFIGYYKHLISKKLVYYLVKQYKLVKEYFFLNLAGASLVDITESEKSQDTTEQIKKTYFSRAAQAKKEVYTSTLETLVVDNSRINYKLFSKIFKYQPTIRYVSLLNTPYLQPFSIEHRKEKNEDVFSIDQLMALINQKNVLISEQNLKEIMVLISKLKKSDMKRKRSRLHKLKLDGNQSIPHHMIDNLVSALFPFINAVHASYTRISAETIKKISESGHNIEYIGIKGCNHLGKDSLIQICDSKGLSKRFRIECILEMKHLIDYEVISHLARSSYLSNMMILDLSCVQVPNMDDCLMNICFTSQDEAINLRIINLENTQISDRGFQMISVSQKFKNLERIYFKGCPLLTERGISFIVDSNNLIRFDLQHFLGQNSHLLNGRIVDTLKYSNRKVLFREINFYESTISDKELSKLMNETRSEFFSVKMINLKFTPHISLEGIKSIYSIYVRSSKKKNDETDRLTSYLEMLYFDEKRQKSLMDNQVEYVKLFEKLIENQYKEIKQPQAKIEGQQPVSEKANQNGSNQQGKKSASIQLSHYSEEFLQKYKSQIILNNESTANSFEEEFKTDFPFIEIIFYFLKLKLFSYDEFFSHHRIQITDETLTALALVRFICMRKFSLKGMAEEGNQKQNNVAMSTIQALKKAEDHLLQFNKLTKINLSKNKSLSETAMCRFFINSDILSKVVLIDISETKATEQVLDSILVSAYLKELKFIKFDKCEYLQFKMNESLLKILKYCQEKTSSFFILKTYYFYQQYLNDEICILYLQHFKEKKIKVKCLNFSMNKELTGQFLKQPLPSVKLINLSYSMFQIQNLNLLAEIENKVKTIWLQNSFNLTDSVVYQALQNKNLTIFDQLTSNNNLRNFRTSEFLYSIGKRLGKSISLLMEKILPNFRTSHLNLNNFPQVDPELLVYLFTKTNLMSSFKQISLNFQIESQTPAYLKILEIISAICEKPELVCLRISKEDEKKNLLAKIKEKLIIDQHITRQYPFVPFQQNADVDINQNFMIYFFSPFSLSTINLSTLLTRKSFKSIIKALRFQNTLEIIILNGLSIVFDKDVIKYFIEEDKKQGFPFKYLKELHILDTNVTQYSLLKILENTPFSSSFKIDECIAQYIDNSIRRNDYSINNQLIEHLSKSVYFINLKKLNLSKVPFTDNILSQLFQSPYAINIEEIILNYTYVSNGTFISIASTKKLPLLKKFQVAEDANCKQHLHYLLRAKNLHLDLDLSKIIFENNIMFQVENYVMSLIDSFYMLKQKALVMKSIQENIDNINQLFKLSQYIVNVQSISITSLTDEDRFYPIWVNLAKTDKLPNLTDLVISKVWVQHLKVLLKQENKPKLDLSKLLFENGDVVDDECLQILANTPNLLNMEEINFSAIKIIENKIKASTLFEFGLSKYVVNIKRIVISEDWKDQLRDNLPEFDEKIKKKKEKHKKLYELYEQTGEEMNVNQNEEKEHTLQYAGIYEAMLLYNNFSNLEEVEFTHPSLLNPLYLLYIAHRIKKRFYSPKFKIEAFFLHITRLLQNPESRPNTEQYKHIISIFNQFFYQDRSWFAKRHRQIHMEMFQILSQNGLYGIRSQIQDWNLVEEISMISKPYDYTMNYLFRANSPILLNLKKFQILDIQPETNNFFFASHVWMEVLKNMSAPSLKDFNLSQLLYKAILPSNPLYVSVETIFRLLSKFTDAFRQMKDLIFDFSLIDTTLMKEILSRLSQSEYCTQLILKCSQISQSETKCVTEQNDIIDFIIDKRCFSKIRRFKPLHKINITSFYKLVVSLFFDKKFNIFEFYNSQVEYIQKPKLTECLSFTINYRRYFSLEEFVIPNFEIDDPKLCELRQFRIHEMIQLNDLKINFSPSISDFEYLFYEVLAINPKIKFTFANITDDILLGLLVPQPIPSLEAQQNVAPMKTENQDQSEQKVEQSDEIILTKVNHQHNFDDFGKDWKKIMEFIYAYQKQLDATKMTNLFIAINQNSSRYYLSGQAFSQQLLLSNVANLTDTIYLPKIVIDDNKSTAQISQLMNKLKYVSSVQIVGQSDFNYNHLTLLYQNLKCEMIYQLIFKHCCQNLSNLELLAINDPEIFQILTQISFNSNKFILDDRSIENIQSMKKRVKQESQEGGSKVSQKQQNSKKTKSKKEQQEDPTIQKAEEQTEQVEIEEQEIIQQEIDKDLAEKGQEKSNIEVQKKKKDISKKQQNENSNNDQEKNDIDEELLKPEKWISKQKLADFIKQFKKLKIIDFSNTKISTEHFLSIDFSNLQLKLQFINLENCQIQNPTIFLTQLLQNYENNRPEKYEQRLQLQRFVSSVNFSNNYQSNIEFMKEIIKSQYFKAYIKYFSFEGLLAKHMQNSSELMKLLSTIFKKGDNSLCITSFLFQLKELRMNITDQELDQISQSYHSIQYTSPFAFNNVQYGFNNIIQHPNVTPRDKVIYFLNQEFQKKLAGNSFYEILYLVFSEKELVDNQILFSSYIMLIEQESHNLSKAISLHSSLLDSFIDRQVGISSTQFQKMQDLIIEMEKGVKDQNLKDQMKLPIINISLQIPKYEMMKQNHEVMLLARREKGQKSKNAKDEMLKSSRLKSSMSSLFLNEPNKDIQKKIKNLEERDLSEKRLQQSERSIIRIIQYIIHLNKKMDEKFDYHELSTLLEFVENLDLGNNSFLNFKGFNNYVKNHISPWLAMNQGIQKLKEPESKENKFDLSPSNLKRLVREGRREGEEAEDMSSKRNDMDNLIEADNELDDKIFDHLCYFIQERMMGLRVINLSGLNVSDQFAEKFSLILSNSSQLQNLQRIDLTNNKRLTAFGMKYLYSTVVNRIPKGFRLDLSSTFSEVQILEARVVALEKKLQNLDMNEINNSKTQNKKQGGATISFFAKLKMKFSRKKTESLQKGKSFEILGGIGELTKDVNIKDKKSELTTKEKGESKDKNTKEDAVQSGEINQLVKAYQNQAISEQELAFLQLKQEFKTFQDYLKSCQEQVEKYDMIGEQVDLTSFLKSGTNISFYSAINSFVLKNWKTHYLLIISIGLIMLPLTLFHLLQLAFSRIHNFFSTYTFDSYLNIFYPKKKYRILIDKNVPSTLTSEDFYFDEDVAVLDQIIKGKNLQIRDSEQKMQLKRVETFLLSPSEKNRKLIKKGQNDESLFNVLKYFQHIIAFNLIVYQIGLAIFYPIYIQYSRSQDTCDQSSIIYDLPIYFYLILSAISEIFLLQNTERIIGSQKIFTTKSLHVLSLLWGSFMAKYDIYTDITFGLQITMCDKLDSFNIGLVCLAITAINVFLSFWAQKNCIVDIYKNRQKKNGEIHNTEYINQYTKLALIQELNAFGTVLDRFSTSSAEAPAIKFKFLQGVLFPQVIISKFTRAFVEDIPQIIILLMYNFRQSSKVGSSYSFFSVQYLKVILSSLLSLYSALSHAWHAKPSIFKTYMFQEFSNFILKGNGGYKIDLKFEDYRQTYSFDKIYEKIKEFIDVYPIPTQQGEQSKKKPMAHIIVANNPSQSHISVESGHKLLDNVSQGGESANVPSSHTLKSVAQPNTETQSEKKAHSTTSLNISESDMSESNQKSKTQQTFEQRLEEYKETLIEYLCTSGFNPEEFLRIKEQLRKEKMSSDLKALSKKMKNY